MLSRPLIDAIAALRREFPTDRVLVDDLAFDAAMAVAASDLDSVLARLLELVAEGLVGDRHPHDAFDLLVAADWLQWDMPAVQAITAWAGAYWHTALLSEPEDVDAGAVLGQLTHLRLPMVKWLSVWLDELDGTGAMHLARFLLDGSTDAAWTDREDERRQVRAWAATEPVVNGLMMIGGSHLSDGQLSAVLDLLISGDDRTVDAS